MNKFNCFFQTAIYLLLTVTGFCQLPTNYFQQEVNTTIKVTLDDVNHTLKGDISIEYINNSPDQLNEIYFHLWANAYQDQTTAFAKQQLRNNSTDFHFSSDNEKGNFEDIAFTVDNQPVTFEYVDNQLDVVKITLAQPLLPSKSITIKTPLNLTIPNSFSRLGHVGTSYQMTQWFPKPAVYDLDGWHQMPYLNQGEFYSEFGSYDVSITLPENYYVASTGVLETASEIAYIEERIQETKDIKSSAGFTKDISFPESSMTMKTIRFTAENVHDFGWFADKRFYIEKSKVDLNYDSVDTYVFYTNQESNLWTNAITYVDRSVEYYSERVGDYPYPHATAVQSALSAGGGMEYPMITVIGLSGNGQSLDQVITHEVGHNWFYGILGFNERDHPWLDEGFNSYYDHHYINIYYDAPEAAIIPEFLNKGNVLSTTQQLYIMQARLGQDQPPNLHSVEFENINYFIGAYEKPALAFQYLSNYIGEDRFDEIMQSLYQTWKFKHPRPQDVIGHFNNYLEEDISWFWDDIITDNKEIDFKIKKVTSNDDNTLNVNIKNKGKVNMPIPVTGIRADSSVYVEWAPLNDRPNFSVQIPNNDFRTISIDPNYKMLDINTPNNSKNLEGGKKLQVGLLTALDNQDRRQLFLLPALGFNEYDGFMLGLGAHNLSLPMPKFKASIVSMYGFKSNKVLGNAYLEYDWVLKNETLKTIQFSLFSKQFSLHSDNLMTGAKIYDKNIYGTIVPEVTFIFNHAPISQIKSELSINTTLVDVSSQLLDAEETTRVGHSFTTLTYKRQKLDPITPWTIEPFAEWQSVDYFFNDKNTNSLKLGTTVKFDYQYDSKKFIKTRFYGAIMPYHSRKLNNRTGLISMVQNGVTDYKYNSYFFGRSELEGGYASQIIEKQGGFKLPGLQAYNFINNTNSYLLTANATLDLPIPFIGRFLDLFIDAAVKGDSFGMGEGFGDISNSIYYSAGLSFGINDYINIYFPILISEELKQVYTKFNERISFSINLNKFEPIQLYEHFKI